MILDYGYERPKPLRESAKNGRRQKTAFRLVRGWSINRGHRGDTGTSHKGHGPNCIADKMRRTELDSPAVIWTSSKIRNSMEEGSRPQGVSQCGDT